MHAMERSAEASAEPCEWVPMGRSASGDAAHRYEVRPPRIFQQHPKETSTRPYSVSNFLMGETEHLVKNAIHILARRPQVHETGSKTVRAPHLCPAEEGDVIF